MEPSIHIKGFSLYFQYTLTGCGLIRTNVDWTNICSSKWNIQIYLSFLCKKMSSFRHVCGVWGTVYPKKYAHAFCFAVLCCGYTLTDFPISIRLTSLALWQSNDCIFLGIYCLCRLYVNTSQCIRTQLTLWCFAVFRCQPSVFIFSMGM